MLEIIKMYRTDKQFMKNPATASSRIYVGSLPENTINKDLEEKFEVHGKILGLVLQKGFGFIQFESETQAKSAIAAEHGSLLHNRKINVRQALEGKPKFTNFQQLSNQVNNNPTPVPSNPVELEVPAAKPSPVELEGPPEKRFRYAQWNRKRVDRLPGGEKYRYF